MKILGEKSLSSKVVIGLKILFVIISLIDLIVLWIMIKLLNGNMQNDLLHLAFLVMIILTGIIALYIIYQFIEIFKNLKNNILFSTNNVKRLNAVSNSCFIISVIYLAISAVSIFIINNFMGELIGYILMFSITLTVIFIVSGIGVKILNEIYKKAIEYKEENDFTI